MSAAQRRVVELNAEQRARLDLSKYPRSAKYDAAWVMSNMMGPNVLWLTEALCQGMHLQPGMRVLDLGCGKALSSIFLAREFGVQVWATDLWISATDNLQRIVAADAGAHVFPVHADARSLPYADGFFDAVVSLDAYHYFGTDDLYLGQHLARLVRGGGEIGVVVPGLANEFAEVPGHLRPYWDVEFSTFHSPNWWKKHWKNTGKVTVAKADRISEGWRDWMTWGEVCADAGVRPEIALREAEMLRVDAGRNLGFTRLVALRN